MKKRGVSIAVKMVALLLVIFVFEGMLIGYNVIHGDVLEYMQTNERNIFHERVVNRKNYLEENNRLFISLHISFGRGVYSCDLYKGKGGEEEKRKAKERADDYRLS